MKNELANYPKNLKESMCYNVCTNCIKLLRFKFGKRPTKFRTNLNVTMYAKTKNIVTF